MKQLPGWQATTITPDHDAAPADTTITDRPEDQAGADPGHTPDHDVLIELRSRQALVDRLFDTSGLSERPRPGSRTHTGYEPQPDDEHEPHHRHTVELTTPTGHRYRSTAPPVIPGLPLVPSPPSPLNLRLHYARPETSPLETHLKQLLGAA